MPDKTKPCEHCGKTTSSHPVGNRMFCHTCWNSFTPKEQKEVTQFALENERRTAETFAQIMAQANRNQKKGQPLLLSEIQPLIEEHNRKAKEDGRT